MWNPFKESIAKPAGETPGDFVGIEPRDISTLAIVAIRERLDALELAELNRRETADPEIMNIRDGFVKRVEEEELIGRHRLGKQIAYTVRSVHSLTPERKYKACQVELLRAVVEMHDTEWVEKGEKS